MASQLGVVGGHYLAQGQGACCLPGRHPRRRHSQSVGLAGLQLHGGALCIEALEEALRNFGIRLSSTLTKAASSPQKLSLTF